MRFLVTMNMPSRNGSLVHQVTCEHQSNSIEQFSEMLNDYTHITVTELYRNKSNNWYSVGPIILNSNMVGKVKVVNPESRVHDDRNDY